MISKKQEQNIDKFLKFSEELAWLLDNYKNLKINDSISKIKAIMDNDSMILLRNNNDIHSLVGIFPELFQNKSLFPSNSSIIDFANEVLKMNINPSKNRSKNEIIGEIVCTTYNLTEKEISVVVCALNKLVNNENMIISVKHMKNDNSFSWNEIIQKLAEEK